MPEINVDIDVDIYCSCGQGLCNQSKVSTRNRKTIVTIEPCEKCLNKAKEDGYEEGYGEAQRGGDDARVVKVWK